MKIFFNHKEELWNSWSHAAGIVMGVAAGAVLEMRCKKIAPMAGLGVAVQEEPGSPVV